MIDPDALWVTKKLRNAGHEAYIVGGAVRDLLVGKVPKDFDICTDANPRKIRKVFRHSRIIGRRFRLVHVYFPQQKFLEVSTFRSRDSGNGQNIYGSIDEDAMRRDFTLNALYYCPKDEYIIDHTKGYKDIQKGKIKPVIPLDHIFLEDPVRILRCLKYSQTIGFDLTYRLKRRIKKDVSLVESCSISRLTEELFKVLSSGFAQGIIQSYYQYGVLKSMLPEVHTFLARGRENKKALLNALRQLDDKVQKESEERRSRMLYYLLKPLWELEDFSLIPSKERFSYGIKYSKKAMAPLIAANKEIEGALRYYFKKKKWSAARPPRRRRPN